MVDMGISSNERHSSVVIEAGFSLCRIASTWSQVMSTSYIIPFHRAKFFPSNFRISTLVPDYVTIILLEVHDIDLVFFSQLDDFSSWLFCYSSSLDNKVTLIPLVGMICQMNAEECMRTCKVKCAYIKQHKYLTNRKKVDSSFNWWESFPQRFYMKLLLAYFEFKMWCYNFHPSWFCKGCLIYWAIMLHYIITSIHHITNHSLFLLSTSEHHIHKYAPLVYQ